MTENSSNVFNDFDEFNALFASIDQNTDEIVQPELELESDKVQYVNAISPSSYILPEEFVTVAPDNSYISMEDNYFLLSSDPNYIEASGISQDVSSAVETDIKSNIANYDLDDIIKDSDDYETNSQISSIDPRSFFQDKGLVSSRKDARRKMRIEPYNVKCRIKNRRRLCTKFYTHVKNNKWFYKAAFNQLKDYNLLYDREFNHVQQRFLKYPSIENLTQIFQPIVTVKFMDEQISRILNISDVSTFCKSLAQSIALREKNLKPLYLNKTPTCPSKPLKSHENKNKVLSKIFSRSASIKLNLNNNHTNTNINHIHAIPSDENSNAKNIITSTCINESCQNENSIGIDKPIDKNYLDSAKDIPQVSVNTVPNNNVNIPNPLSPIKVKPLSSTLLNLKKRVEKLKQMSLMDKINAGESCKEKTSSMLTQSDTHIDNSTIPEHQTKQKPTRTNSKILLSNKLNSVNETVSTPINSTKKIRRNGKSLHSNDNITPDNGENVTLIAVKGKPRGRYAKKHILATNSNIAIHYSFNKSPKGIAKEPTNRMNKSSIDKDKSFDTQGKTNNLDIIADSESDDEDDLPLIQPTLTSFIRQKMENNNVTPLPISPKRITKTSQKQNELTVKESTKNNGNGNQESLESTPTIQPTITPFIVQHINNSTTTAHDTSQIKNANVIPQTQSASPNKYDRQDSMISALSKETTDQIYNALKNRINTILDNYIPAPVDSGIQLAPPPSQQKIEEICERMAHDIEMAMRESTNLDTSNTHQYKAKCRAICYNLNDPKNRIFYCLIDDEIKPSIFVTMTQDKISQYRSMSQTITPPKLIRALRKFWSPHQYKPYGKPNFKNGLGKRDRYNKQPPLRDNMHADPRVRSQNYQTTNNKRSLPLTSKNVEKRLPEKTNANFSVTNPLNLQPLDKVSHGPASLYSEINLESDDIDESKFGSTIERKTLLNNNQSTLALSRDPRFNKNYSLVDANLSFQLPSFHPDLTSSQKTIISTNPKMLKCFECNKNYMVTEKLIKWCAAEKSIKLGFIRAHEAWKTIETAHYYHQDDTIIYKLYPIGLDSINNIKKSNNSNVSPTKLLNFMQQMLTNSKLLHADLYFDNTPLSIYLTPFRPNKNDKFPPFLYNTYRNDIKYKTNDVREDQPFFIGILVLSRDKRDLLTQTTLKNGNKTPEKEVIAIIQEPPIKESTLSLKPPNPFDFLPTTDLPHGDVDYRLLEQTLIQNVATRNAMNQNVVIDDTKPVKQSKLPMQNYKTNSYGSCDNKAMADEEPSVNLDDLLLKVAVSLKTLETQKTK